MRKRRKLEEGLCVGLYSLHWYVSAEEQCADEAAWAEYDGVVQIRLLQEVEVDDLAVQ